MSFAGKTTVPVEKSRAGIETLVSKYGATRFSSGWQEGSAAINFVANGCLVRFILPLPTKDDESVTERASKKRRTRGPVKAESSKLQRAIEEETRRRWRCLLLAIQAKLVVVETGIEKFEQAFLANIVTAKNITVYEQVQLANSGIKLLTAATAGDEP